MDSVGNLRNYFVPAPRGQWDSNQNPDMDGPRPLIQPANRIVDNRTLNRMIRLNEDDCTD